MIKKLKRNTIKIENYWITKGSYYKWLKNNSILEVNFV
jgi:hypothetical protein